MEYKSNDIGDNDNTTKNKDTSVSDDDEITSCDDNCNCCSSNENDWDEPPRKRRRINSNEIQQEKECDKQRQNNNHNSHNGAPDRSADEKNSSQLVEKCFTEEYCQYLEKASLSASPKRICHGRYVYQCCFEVFILCEVFY